MDTDGNADPVVPDAGGEVTGEVRCNDGTVGPVTMSDVSAVDVVWDVFFVDSPLRPCCDEWDPFFRYFS